MALFSDAMTVALSMTFTLVLVLILRYYDQITIVSEEYKEAKDLVNAVIIQFKGELRQHDERVDELSKEIMSLRSIERNLVKIIGIIALIFVIIASLQIMNAFMNSYRTGDVTSFVEWFANWLAENIEFAVYILIAAAI